MPPPRYVPVASVSIQFKRVVVNDVDRERAVGPRDAEHALHVHALAAFQAVTR